jgi:hypothetical protein
MAIRLCGWEQIKARVFIHIPANASRFSGHAPRILGWLGQTLGGSHEIHEGRFHVLPIAVAAGIRHSSYLCSEWLCTRFAVISGTLKEIHHEMANTCS